MNHDLSCEERIVWLEDPTKYTYLREGVYGTTRRRGRISSRGFILLGYAEHRQGPGGGIQPYVRRYWWLTPSDRDLDPTGVYEKGVPAEAVEPASIAVGTPSRHYIEPDTRQA